MFSLSSRLARLSLRRGLHTSAGSPSSSGSLGRTARVAIGASAVTATYITWQLTREYNRTHCDIPQPSKSTEHSKIKPSRPTHAPSEPKLSTESTSATEIDVFTADAPSEESKIVTSSEATEGESESSPEGGAAAGGGGAYNPETGEINWDCPCLGGMAHGPCGPEFREAFSCFIYSEEEPKGINCVDKFQNMQNCFRAHPDVYGDEIMRDEEEDEEAPASANGSSDLPPAESLNEEQLKGDATLSSKGAQIKGAAVSSDL